MANQLFTRKPLGMLLEELEGKDRLKRVLGPAGLTSMGIGAVIGAGIFVSTGQARTTDSRSVTDDFLCCVGHRLHFRRALLRRVRVDGPRGWISLHLRVRNSRRVIRVDYRLGPAAGICRRGGCRGQQLVVILSRGHGDGWNTTLTEVIERSDHRAQCGPWPAGDDRSIRQSSRGARRDRGDGPPGQGHPGEPASPWRWWP